jgi:putative ABC transport system substrate-binding protein
MRPLAVRAQQTQRMRRIGVFMNLASDDPEAQARLAAFHQGLQELGWIVGQNVTIDYRWRGAAADGNRKSASELVALAPDVLLAAGPAVEFVHEVTSTVPIVFTGVVDPVGRGLVKSLAQPGSNATGFTPFEFSLSGKLLQLLKQIAPQVKQVAVFRDATVAGVGQFAAIQAVAPSLGIVVRAVDVRDAGDIEGAVVAFARARDGGLVVPLSSPALIHRQVIITLTAKYRLPAVYTYRVFAADGGLLSYAPDELDPYRQAAGYINRILKGEAPADLPVQVPTKFNLVINLKTAKALGLTIPETLLATADEVIQ